MFNKTLKCGHHIKYDKKFMGFYSFCSKCSEIKAEKIGLNLFKIKLKKGYYHIDEISEKIWEKLNYGL